MELIETPNPNAKKILLNHEIQTGTVIDEPENTDNEIFKILIGTEGVVSLFVGPGFVTLTKDQKTNWESINEYIVTKFDKL
tara:strand:- start:71 stop:313 length:243 start_codon:yes stop_codon:yes gene_type:complete